MTKSYKDHEFMMGLEARPLRILAEYLEPRDRLQRYQVRRSLIFFGSARIRPNSPDSVADAVDYYAEARALAARLAQWTTEQHQELDRYHICTGGGPGIMEAANRGANDVNPDLSMGYNISLPQEQGSNAYISPKLNFYFHYFFMRKFWFMYVAHGLVVFPGGFGTMDELFEMLTLIQTGKQAPIPIILFGKKFWQKLIDFDFFEQMGLISRADLDLFTLVETVDEAFAAMCTALEDNMAAQSNREFPKKS